MSQEIANLIAQFMQRVDLKGSEVQAWSACMEALKDIAQPTMPEDSAGE
jgi:hypothetical protein